MYLLWGEFFKKKYKVGHASRGDSPANSQPGTLGFLQPPDSLKIGCSCTESRNIWLKSGFSEGARVRLLRAAAEEGTVTGRRGPRPSAHGEKK